MNVLDAIQFYEGDTKQTNDPLFSDNKAYVTFNAMYFDGIENELIKVQEGKKLNPYFIQRYQEIYGPNGLTEALFKEMKNELPHPLYHTTRVERLSDFQSMCHAGRTIAFTSTSENPFLHQYGDKKGIVLLQCEIPASVPCIRFKDVLQKYKKEEEAEILLPPNLSFETTQLTMGEDDLSILDQDHNPPVGKYKLQFTSFQYQDISTDTITEAMIKDSIKLYESLNRKEELNESYLQSYLSFKHRIQSLTQQQMQKLF